MIAVASRFLQQKFTEFVVELQRQKARALEGGWAFDASPAAPFDPAQPGDRGPNPLWEALAGLLRRQAREAERTGTSGETIYREAQYAMVALADEVFIGGLGDWPGRDAWKRYHLELALFGSQVAGQEVFRRIDRLLARRDPGQRDLAEVYFYVLSLGFRGTYATALHDRGAGFTGAVPEIEERRRRLRECFDEGDGRDAGWVSPEPYEHIETREVGGYVPGVVQSLTFLIVVVACLLVATFTTGYLLTGSIDRTIDEIESRIEVQEERG